MNPNPNDEPRDWERDERFQSNPQEDEENRDPDAWVLPDTTEWDAMEDWDDAPEETYAGAYPWDDSLQVIATELGLELERLAQAIVESPMATVLEELDGDLTKLTIESVQPTERGVVLNVVYEVCREDGPVYSNEADWDRPGDWVESQSYTAGEFPVELMLAESLRGEELAAAALEQDLAVARARIEAAAVGQSLHGNQSVRVKDEFRAQQGLPSDTQEFLMNWQQGDGGMNLPSAAVFQLRGYLRGRLSLAEIIEFSDQANLDLEAWDTLTVEAISDATNMSGIPIPVVYMELVPILALAAALRERLGRVPASDLLRVTIEQARQDCERLDFHEPEMPPEAREVRAVFESLVAQVYHSN
ncbi:hypothetical protein HY375_02025 [Candidatus Berkelbacteria bacterium]|nr:hypothetical protein [Candidatus Berkelbacteria bacterium]